jgi:hypothetical protein
VAGDLVRLERALDQVEAILEAVDPSPRPELIVLEVFTDDTREAVLTYTDQLWERFPRSLVVTIEALCERPAGNKMPWTTPRAWLDYEPTEEEVANLRTTPGAQLAATPDWSPPIPDEALDVGPGAEHRARITKARERWVRRQEKDGTELPEWMLTPRSDGS